jgi:hypothetical protein
MLLYIIRIVAPCCNGVYICEECLTVHNLSVISLMGQMKNDGLESENMFVFMDKADSRNLGLSNEPTY